jgi:hypothetical protein
MISMLPFPKARWSGVFVVGRIDLQAVGEEERDHAYLPVPGSAFCVSICTFVPVK